MGYQCSFAERMVSRTGLPRDDQESTKYENTLVVQQVAAAGSPLRSTSTLVSSFALAAGLHRR
jgi:hypothetical protein